VGGRWGEVSDMEGSNTVQGLGRGRGGGVGWGIIPAGCAAGGGGRLVGAGREQDTKECGR